MKTKIEEIAERFLKVETLDTRNRDRLDFYNIPVWQIKAALEAAYNAGKDSIVKGSDVGGVMKYFEQGQKVNTPLGTGRVAYQMLKPPEYREAATVSVFLDSKRNYISYFGTKFKAEDVTPC